ncbi:NAD(P)-dependent oxidoreductase [Cetobacterium somerae]|uniref:NAD(P)-dependent oxidoreductase n=1 Tax=Cetobacterium TaxID=180162 RepID=UPI0022564F8C|nr:NAD(P)-dependent oxidoreductase [Cetobacterium somerae]MCX3066858.1 NAD(P)-dependent oxidoreductase [Cetobacterium somerae]
MRIGFIGLGLMGEPMSSNIIKKLENEVLVFDIDSEKVKKMETLGATGATSIKEIGEKADVIISMVPKSEHVQSVYQQLLEVARANQIFIDMSTIDPKVSINLAKQIAEKGAVMLDAPVVKSVPAAEAGVLGIYVGGEQETYNSVKFILECMGNNIIHLGDNGSGLVMKLCHNTLVSQIQNGVNEMITLSQRNGIPTEDFIKAISYGGGQNFYLDGKGKAIMDNNFATAFSVENMHKDVHLTGNLLDELGLNLPGVRIVQGIYDEAINRGYGKEDFCATIKVVRD